MSLMLRVRLGAWTGRTRRAVMLVTAVVFAAGLAVAVTQVAGAEPQPSVSSVKATINNLTGQFNKANQQYDQVEEQLTSAKSQLNQVNKQLTRQRKQYAAARKLVVQIAASSYEDSGSTSLAGLLTSNDPSQVLAEASIVMQITDTRNLETVNFLSDASQLISVQQEQQRTEQGIEQLAATRATSKNHIASLLAKEKTILNGLTATEVDEVEEGTVNSGGGVTDAIYTGTTATQAGKAVSFVFAQQGCEYSYGSTGPCGAGFDCSGLVMSAWAAAGVSIPRDTYEQWAALPHVSTSDLEPGDLVFYNGIGHVAMYVGNGMIIDAPTEGEVVREIPMSTAWYADSLDGAARP
jgi:cell wall-associated NlpC family hydrolase